jgi:hypothetical protein
MIKLLNFKFIVVAKQTALFFGLLIFLAACGGGEETPDDDDDDTVAKLQLSVTFSGEGQVTSSPSGINCSADCDAEYDEGSQVSLTATAASGYSFVGWSGNCTGTGNCDVQMSAAQNVVATFELEQTENFTLQVSVSGSGVVSSSPSGIDCGSDCSQSYEDGTTVTLSAAPASGFQFSGWSGSCTGSGDCQLAMTAQRSAVAEFAEIAPENHTLMVSVTGSGDVTSSPSGINCGSDCNESYSAGTSVSLTATPDSGFEFISWTGGCGGSGVCEVTMNAQTSVAAEFREIGAESFTLTVSTPSNGTISSSPVGIDCGSDCSQSYVANTQVSLTATPDDGFEFVSWSGDCSGASACSVTMDQARSVSASFQQVTLETFTLTVNVSGNGSVASTPAGISCGSDCTETFDDGTSVLIIATPNTGFKLSSWSGACSGNVDCNVTVDQDLSVTATFVEDNGGGGTLAIEDMGTHEVDFGDVFTYQPQITGDATICRKDLGHDDVTVDSETGLIRWDTSDVNFGRGFHIRIKCSNFEESAYGSMVVHVDKSGTSRLRIAGEGGVSQYIGDAARAMTSGDTIVFADGNYPVSVSRDESYENGFSRSAPTSGNSDQYSTIISRNPGGAVINGEAQNGIGKQKKAFELSTNSYVAIVGFVVKNVQRESFTTKGTNTKLLLDFIGGQGAGTWGRVCDSFSASSSGECSNAGMRINGGTGMFQHSYDWGHNRYGIMTNRTSGSITRRSFVRLDEHRGDQPYGGFSNYCDTLHLSQDNRVCDSLASAAPHYKNYAGREAYPATGCENDSATLKTVGLLAVNNKLSLSLMDQKAGPTHIWDQIVSFDSEGTCTPQTDRCGLWLLQADKAIDVSNSFFGKARGFEGGTSRGQAFGNNITFTDVVIDDVSGVNDAGTKPDYLPQSQLYYQGRYDTFHGEDRYDEPTTARRWPIAGEDIIAANMRAYRNPTAYRVGGGTVDINGDRGATATGESMSEYFWGYTNDLVPPLVVRVKDKGAVHRVAWEHLSGSRRASVTGWKVVCVGAGNAQLASLSVSQLTYDDDSGCESYAVKASYASGDSGIAYIESPQ